MMGEEERYVEVDEEEDGEKLKPHTAGSSNGAEILDEVRGTLARYVAFPSNATLVAVTLFVAATHAQEAWEHATRLVVKSPLKRCGKTRLLEVLAELCHHVLRTTNISVAALVRSIDETNPPTLLLDEADTIFAKRRGERSEGAEDLRGILNSGHARGWPYVRWDAAARKSETCPTFAMAVLAGIGNLPDTIEDRAVVISMRRRAPKEHVTAWRRRHAVPELQALRAQVRQWVTDQVEILMLATPAMPVQDRAADVWEPLIAIADSAGNEWPALARDACRSLAGHEDPEDGTAGERLLADLREVLTEDRLHTAVIIERLVMIDEAPWTDWKNGRALDARVLARLLKPYGVRSKNFRITGDGVVKGYARADLEDAWDRYLGTPTATGATALHGVDSAGQPRSGSVAESDPRAATPADQHVEAACSAVAPVAQHPPSNEHRHEFVPHRKGTAAMLARRAGWARTRIGAAFVGGDRRSWICYLRHAPAWEVEDAITALGNAA